MKKNVRWLRAASLILAVLLGLSACAVPAETPEGTEPSAGTGTEEPHRDPGLAERTFGGADYRIQSSADARDTVYNPDIKMDVINEAVYDRNRYIERTYDVHLRGVVIDDMMTALLQANASGLTVCELVLETMWNYATLIDRNCLADLKKVPNLNLSSPWWDQNCVANMSIAHALYFCTGDIMIGDKMGCWAVTFNRDIVASHRLEDPYELVNADEWTYDKMYALAAAVCTAADHDKGDYFSITWGILSENANAYMMWQGSGFRLIRKDPETDIPAFCPLSENAYNAMVKIYTMQRDKNVTLLDSDIQGMPHGTSDQLLYQGHALFEIGSMSGIENMREIDMDFGVLPMPKLDSTLKGYYTSMSPTATCAAALPDTCKDKAFAGYIMEALACESTDTLLNAYYDKTLVHKGLRQEKDEKMLDLIFANRVYDLTQVYNWAESLMLEIGKSKNSTRLKSLADSYANSTNHAIQEFLKNRGLA